jgi:ATP-binding cassette, subfamily B, bacterial
VIHLSRQWRTFVTLFSDSRTVIATSLAVAAGQSILLVPIALIIRGVFDHAIPDGDTGQLVVSGAIVLGLFMLNAGLGLWSRHRILGSTKRAVTDLRVALLAKLYSLPRAYFDHTDVGVLHATLVQDTERVDIAANVLMSQLLPAWLIAFALMVALLVISPLLLGLLLTVAPILVFLARRVAWAARRWASRYHSDYDSLGAHAQVALRSITLTKALGAEEAELAAREREAKEVERSSLRMTWLLSAYNLAQSTITATAGVIVLVVGGASVASGSTSIGTLVAFYAGIALLRGQLGVMAVATPFLVAGADSLERIGEVLDADEPQPYTGTGVLEWTGAVALEGVRFGYGENLVLDGVDLDLKPSERVALLGPNGAGKSTILSLLLGLYRPWSGRLTADGIPYDELNLDGVRQRLGVVLQDPIIFRGSVFDNVRYGCPDATEEDVRRALELAGAGRMLASLPAGLDTQVGDEGGLLSGGQRQRLAIARALVRKPALVILDEPSVHLDEEGTRGLLDSLTELPGPPAVLVVTHDPVVAAFADRYFILRGGRVTEADDVAGSLPAMASGR